MESDDKLKVMILTQQKYIKDLERRLRIERRKSSSLDIKVRQLTNQNNELIQITKRRES